MKLAAIGAVLLAAGLVGVWAGVLPLADALAIGERVWPVLLFVVAITIVAELAAIAGVFDVAGHLLARLGRGRTMLLCLLVVGLAVLVTAFLSLDTTAVLLTPVVVAVARAHGLPPLPFAFATVWLANTASLVLPVSNLTNLLATERLSGGHDAGRFLSLLGPSAAVAIVVTVVILWVVHRARLRGRYRAAGPPAVEDRVLLRAAAVVVGLLLPLLVLGLEPWLPASAAAIALGLLYLWRAPQTLRPALVPWSLIVFASGLFLATEMLAVWGSGAVIAVLAGSGEDLFSLWQVAGVGAVAANLVNNLPAYLVLEPIADSPARLAALLIGVGAGPLVTPWASLATLLWHQRLKADGIDVPWVRYAVLGAVGAPLIVACAVIPLDWA